MTGRPVATDPPVLTLIGGPTLLIEWRGLRLLTDPTFDPAGTTYETPVYTLRKRTAPAVAAESLGHVDVVLLSHDHHFDNLDRIGRDLLPRADRVLTTTAATARLGLGEGLSPWDVVDIHTGADTLRVTATPARHGPADMDRGPVIGFHMAWTSDPEFGVYVSGDTVWYEGVAEIARRLPVRVAVLHLGAARVAAVGPVHLTMTADEAVLAARSFDRALIVPIHYEGWEHFTESRLEIDAAFAVDQASSRVRWLEPGRATAVE